MTTKEGEYVVVRVKNDHDAMTVMDPAQNSTFHVVECENADLDRLIDSVDRGEEIALELRRVGRRGNAWCVANAEGVGGESDRPGADAGGDPDPRSDGDPDPRGGDRDRPVGGGPEGVRSGDGNPPSEGEETDPAVGN